MTGKVVKTLALLVVCGAVISSCSKYKSNENIVNDKARKGMMSGTWVEFQNGADSNGNSIVDSSEVKAVTAANNTTFKFAIDGSGSYFVHDNAVDTTYALNWSLENEEKDLKIALTGGDTRMYNIQGINDLYLTLSNTSVSPKTWTVYKKQ